MLYFNPEITINQIIFKREPLEGRWLSRSEPLVLSYDSIRSYGPGQITLDNGETIFCEEDTDQIYKLKDDKLQELARYEARMKELDRLGIGPDTEVPNG